MLQNWGCHCQNNESSKESLTSSISCWSKFVTYHCTDAWTFHWYFLHWLVIRKGSIYVYAGDVVLEVYVCRWSMTHNKWCNHCWHSNLSPIENCMTWYATWCCTILASRVSIAITLLVFWFCNSMCMQWTKELYVRALQHTSVNFYDSLHHLVSCPTSSGMYDSDLSAITLTVCSTTKEQI